MKKRIIKEITERKQAEEQLQKAYDELDIRVRERTFDLAEANKLLMAEIAERKRTRKAAELFGKRPPDDALQQEKVLRTSEDRSIEAKRYARPLTIIMLDIDYFKKVNDNYGHNIGDGTEDNCDYRGRYHPKR